MKKIGRVSHSLDFIAPSQAGCPRFEGRLGWIEIIVLLIIVLTLVSCKTSSNSETVSEFLQGGTSSTALTVTAPSNITIAATNASGKAEVDPAIISFLNGANTFDGVDSAISTITNDAPLLFPLGPNAVTFSAPEAPLATAATDETFGGVFWTGVSSNRMGEHKRAG